MTPEQAQDYRFDIFDITKVWPHADFPLIEIGKMVLNRNPENYFAEVEQAAFSPGNFVPGIAASPDKMLQARTIPTTMLIYTVWDLTTNSYRSMPPKQQP